MQETGYIVRYSNVQFFCSIKIFVQLLTERKKDKIDMMYPLTNQDNCGQEYWTLKHLPCVVAFLRGCLFHFVIKKYFKEGVCARFSVGMLQAVSYM